jgi:gluconokinase
VSHRTDHYMPPSLLHSQFDILEPLEPDEPGVRVSVDGSAAEVLQRVVAALGVGDEPTTRHEPAP